MFRAVLEDGTVHWGSLVGADVTSHPERPCQSIWVTAISTAATVYVIVEVFDIPPVRIQRLSREEYKSIYHRLRAQHLVTPASKIVECPFTMEQMRDWSQVWEWDLEAHATVVEDDPAVCRAKAREVLSQQIYSEQCEYGKVIRWGKREYVTVYIQVDFDPNVIIPF